MSQGIFLSIESVLDLWGFYSLHLTGLTWPYHLRAMGRSKIPVVSFAGEATHYYPTICILWPANHCIPTIGVMKSKPCLAIWNEETIEADCLGKAASGSLQYSARRKWSLRRCNTIKWKVWIRDQQLPDNLLLFWRARPSSCDLPRHNSTWSYGQKGTRTGFYYFP